jgi:hypothetical protein
MSSACTIFAQSDKKLSAHLTMDFVQYCLNRLLLLHQLNIAEKAKTERQFIREERSRNTDVLQGFLTTRGIFFMSSIVGKA